MYVSIIVHMICIYTVVLCALVPIFMFLLLYNCIPGSGRPSESSCEEMGDEHQLCWL